MGVKIFGGEFNYAISARLPGTTGSYARLYSGRFRPSDNNNGYEILSQLHAIQECAGKENTLVTVQFPGCKRECWLKILPDFFEDQINMLMYKTVPVR